MQTSYPFFESGQVLSATHLNDLVAYLEEQDRLTRNKLIGIGIGCGLQVGWEAASNQVRITGGVAITSQGYLFVHEATLYSHYRTYTVPVPHVEEAPDDLLASTSYSFFYDEASGKQINLLELLPVGFIANPGEPGPTLIDSTFVQDKVVLLFLERNLESLKNCDINDCSDKGAEWEFTLRALLVGQTAAQIILDQEAAIALRPVDRHNHPRYDLQELQVEKLNLAAHNVTSFSGLFWRIAGVANSLVAPLTEALSNSYAAFQYLLADIYPASTFPNGPFGDPLYFNRVIAQSLSLGNLVLSQYFYAYLVDLVRSYNEFLRAAMQLDAECCPHPDRFPLHVLLGQVLVQPTAFAPTGPGQANFDPLTVNSGLGATTRRAAFRHHFIPSPLYDCTQGAPAERLAEVRSLHYRTYLLAYRYTLDGLLEKAIRITPSKEGDVPLSEQAIPFYYALLADKKADDLVRNWAYAKIVHNRLDRVFSYQYIDPADHPLRYRMDDHNFYRVEGAVGKGLGVAMQTLLEAKRQRGLDFGIEPVYVSLRMDDDLASQALDTEAQARARLALLKLLVCRMSDLDVVFLLWMTPLFHFILAIITWLTQFNTSQLAGITRSKEDETGARSGGNAEVGAPITRLSPKQAQSDRRAAEALLKELRQQAYQKGTLTAKLTTATDPKVSIGRLYQEIKEGSSTANLFDRALEFARGLGGNEKPEELAQRIYPTLSLLDKTEELVASVCAPSLAEFDFPAFEVRYDGFVGAFEAFLDQAPPGDENTPLRQAYEAVAANYSSIAAATPQAVLTGLASEFLERLAKIFSDLLLGPYAQRRPGMEHKGGVPVGGTLILLYTHRNFFAQTAQQNRAAYEKQFNEVRARYAPNSSPGARTDPNAIPNAPQPAVDPLDDFVVLADFCLPYLCCDSDCSDIDLSSEEGSQPTPSVVRGTVFAVQTASDTPQATPVKSARVAATNLDTNKTLTVELSNGAYAFTARPGSYRIDVHVARGFLPAERIITVGAGSERTEDFVLQRRT